MDVSYHIFALSVAFKIPCHGKKPRAAKKARLPSLAFLNMPTRSWHAKI